MTVPFSQSILGFTGGVFSSMTAYSLLVDQLRTDTRALDQSLHRFRQTLEYGLPLFIRDEASLTSRSLISYFSFEETCQLSLS